MLNILLIVQIVISLLLVTVILLQRTGSDSLSGLSGGGTSGVMSARSAANFLTNSTIVLASLFLLNSVVLANLSSKVSQSNLIDPIIASHQAEQSQRHEATTNDKNPKKTNQDK
ncbi:MAG: preprotein translocase subunit SecG [Rickettsiaceae bacterium]|nr:preprotein translocase subunit SecG [Rickettsiaceae bacterium]